LPEVWRSFSKSVAGGLGDEGAFFPELKLTVFINYSIMKAADDWETAKDWETTKIEKQQKIGKQEKTGTQQMTGEQQRLVNNKDWDTTKRLANKKRLVNNKDWDTTNDWGTAKTGKQQRLGHNKKTGKKKTGKQQQTRTP
jgi:hypothetical protein